MKKYSILALCAILVVAACGKDIDKAPAPEVKDMVFHASIEQNPETKTYLEWNGEILGYNVCWWAGNEIRVFDGTATPRKFIAKSKGASSDFSGSAADAATYYALYPYDGAATCSEGVFTTTLPSTQALGYGDITDNTNISVAVSDGSSFAFKNVCTILAFRVTQTVKNCSYVVLEANNGAALAGDITVNYNSGNPSVTAVASPSSSIRLNNGSADLEGGAAYFCTVLPADLATGFTISFYNSSDELITSVSSTKEADLPRSKVYNLGNLPVPIAINGTKLTYNSVKKSYSGDFTFDGSPITVAGITDLEGAYNRDFFSLNPDGTLNFLRNTAKTWTVEYFPDYNYIWVSNNMLGFPDILYIAGNGKMASPRWYSEVGNPSDYYWSMEAPYYCVAPLAGSDASTYTFQTTSFLTTATQWGDVRLYFGKGGGQWATLNAGTALSGDNASMFEIADDGDGTLTLHSKGGFDKDGYYRLTVTYDRTLDYISTVNFTKLD